MQLVQAVAARGLEPQTSTQPTAAAPQQRGAHLAHSIGDGIGAGAILQGSDGRLLRRQQCVVLVRLRPCVRVGNAWLLRYKARQVCCSVQV